MKTIELMSTAPRSVRATERLDVAARVLWEADCGIVPVVDGAGVLLGVVTDRDLCMAAYTKGCALTEVPVSAVMAREVTTCRPEDLAVDVMQAMQRRQVHRLPVVDAHGKLVGVVSTNDLVRASHARPAAVDPTVVVRTLATIGAPRGQAEAVFKGPARPAEASPATAVPTSSSPKAPKKKQAARSRSSSGKKAAPKKTASKKRPSKKAAARKAPIKKSSAKKAPARKARATSRKSR